MDFSNIIAAELQRYPNLEVEINSDDAHARLLAGQIAADVAKWQRSGFTAQDYTALHGATFDAVMALRKQPAQTGEE